MAEWYQQITERIVNSETDFEAALNIRLAYDVVSKLHSELGSAAALGIEYSSPLLLVSLDVVSFGDAPMVDEQHWRATGFEHGRALSFGAMSAKRAAAIFSLNEDEVHVALIMAIIGLRRLSEGPSSIAERSVRQSLERLKALLSFALMEA